MAKKNKRCWQNPPDDPERPAPTTTPLLHETGRRRVKLDGVWRLFCDPMRGGRRRQYWLEREQKPSGPPLENEHDQWGPVRIPGDWNTQIRELANYDGWCWLARRFSFSARIGERLFLRFGAVNYRAEVWLNGRRLGAHEGGFTPFEFEITDALRKKNLLVVLADATLRPEGAPTSYYDWFNYGGITRSVEIIRVPKNFVRTFRVHWAERPGGGVICVETALDGPRPPRSARFEIPSLKLRGTVPLREGRGTAEFPAAPKLWSPEQPKLYNVRLSAGADSVSDSVGFRTVSVNKQRVLLNGKPIFLRGISLHEERPTQGGGRTLSAAEIKKLLGHAKALGCNFLRLAHYPHAEQTVKLAERLGFMLWAEAPVYWGVQFSNPATLANCESQLREMIWRDYNRASVITWSVGNETPNFPERDRFFKALIRQVRSLDRTRLVSAAFVVERGRDDYHRGVFSRIARQLDLTGLNQYFGWYELNEKDDLERVNWDVAAVEKPVIFSEFGAEALAGLHGRVGQRWTEEDQADVYRRQVRMISRLSWCAGTTPWLLTDFRSTWRAGRHQNGYNRKGLLSHDLRRKQAFDVLREFYECKRRE